MRDWNYRDETIMESQNILYMLVKKYASLLTQLRDSVVRSLRGGKSSSPRASARTTACYEISPIWAAKRPRNRRQCDVSHSKVAAAWFFVK